MDEEINHGVILGSGTENLYVGGTIPYQVVNPSGDWRPYAPSLEKQRNPLETLACVSFSCNNVIETQYKFFGIDVNFSDRFLAKMSGTTQNGNRLDKVADTARLIGLVKEEEWKNDPSFNTWVEYYADIPQSVKDKAVKQPIAYEPVTITEENLKKELKHAPIQIVIVKLNPYHAVSLLYIHNGIGTYLDHYLRLKTIPVSDISYGLKIVLNKSKMTNALIVKNGAEYGVYFPATSEDALISYMRVMGLPVPLKADGKLDWTQVHVDKQLS